MPDLISPLKQLATSWRGDLLLAVVLLIWALAYLIVVAAALCCRASRPATMAGSRRGRGLHGPAGRTPARTGPHD